MEELFFRSDNTAVCRPPHHRYFVVQSNMEQNDSVVVSGFSSARLAFLSDCALLVWRVACVVMTATSRRLA